MSINFLNENLNTIKMKIIITLIGITLLSSCLWAQETGLKRRAALGLRLSQVNDSIARANGLDETKGVYVSNVLEGTTADKVGIKEADIITQLNGININSTQDIVTEIGQYRNGDKLKVVLYRNGKRLVAKGIAHARPMEQSDLAEVVYSSVSYKGNQLRTILHHPKGKEKAPVVFFIQGYPCQSIDLAYSSQQPTRKLIDDWVAAGYAVYRIEKPGMGDSKSEKNCFDINFLEEVEVFRNGYMDLQNKPQIDADNIFLFGHSIGGIVAPLIASEFNPKGVMTYGTLVNTWFEYMQELTRVQGLYFNRSDIEIEADIRNATPFWYEMLVAQKSNEEILQNVEIYKLLEQEGTLENFKNGQFIHRHYTYWVSIQNLVLSMEWAKVKSKVLALYGEFDIEALNPDHIYAIERIVNRHHPNLAKAKVIKNADHGFVRFKSMDEKIEVMNMGQYWDYMANHYHKGIGETTINWMNQLK